jgi:cactin
MASYRNKPDRSRNRPPSSIPRKRPADEEEDKWVADEDRFVLKQAKRKAILRVRGGRARPIDWLTVILRAIDKTDDLLDENEEQGELDIVQPEGVFEGLSRDELGDLERDIDTYLVRETDTSNKDYWSVRKPSFLV